MLTTGSVLHKKNIGKYVFLDKADFTLRRNVNSQYSRRIMHLITFLCMKKVTVWCAASVHKTIESKFFEEAINSDCYNQLIPAQFCRELREEKMDGYFMQENTMGQREHF
jgi:hypothetical protein